jgi:hypothetical protein
MNHTSERPSNLRATWSSAVGDASGARFASVTDIDVTLEGSIFRHPIIGRDRVFAALRVASEVYDSLEFTHEVNSPGRSYLEWEATAMQQDIAGVTVLTFQPAGTVSRVMIHHRPLGAVLAVSAHMRHQLVADGFERQDHARLA